MLQQQRWDVWLQYDKGERTGSPREFKNCTITLDLSPRLMKIMSPFIGCLTLEDAQLHSWDQYYINVTGFERRDGCSYKQSISIRQQGI